MTRIVVEYRMTPRGQWWEDTYEHVYFSAYEGYEHVPPDWIVVDFRYDYSSKGFVRIYQFEFDVVEDEYWDGPPTYRRQLVSEHIVKRYTKEHSVRVVEGSSEEYSLVAL